MREEDRADFIERYEKRLKETGYSPETLGWGRNGRQELRFAVLAELALQDHDSSVLDVGCGFGDLYDFLTHRGWRGHYTGLDIVPGLLEIAHQRHPGIDLREADITDPQVALDEYDFVISSGVFNAALPSGGNEAHIESALKRMLQLSKQATCVDFLSGYVDFKKQGAHHTDPCSAFALAMRLTRRVRMRGDYMPYEFSLFLFRDDSISERKVFQGFERQIAQDLKGQ